MTKNEGRRYWQEIQITASDKEGGRRRFSPFIQGINPDVRCTQNNCNTVKCLPYKQRTTLGQSH